MHRISLPSGPLVAFHPKTHVAHLYTGPRPRGRSRLVRSAPICGVALTRHSLRIASDRYLQLLGTPCRRCSDTVFRHAPAASTAPARDTIAAAYQGVSLRDLWIAAAFARTTEQVDRTLLAAIVVHGFGTVHRSQSPTTGETFYDSAIRLRQRLMTAALSADERAEIDAANHARGVAGIQRELARQQVERSERRAAFEARVDVFAGFGVQTTRN